MKKNKLILIIVLIVLAFIAAIAITAIVTSSISNNSTNNSNANTASNTAMSNTNTTKNTTNSTSSTNTTTNPTSTASPKANTTATAKATATATTTTNNSSPTSQPTEVTNPSNDNAPNNVPDNSNSDYDYSTSSVALYIGKGSNFTTTNADVITGAPVTDVAENIIKEIGAKLGYQIYIKDVYSGKGGITIDFDKDSAPFNVTDTYRGNGTEEYKTSNQTDLANTIFDSISETSNKYFSTQSNIDIYFSVDGKNITIDNINIDSTTPYKGSSN